MLPDKPLNTHTDLFLYYILKNAKKLGQKSSKIQEGNVPLDCKLVLPTVRERRCYSADRRFGGKAEREYSLKLSISVLRSQGIILLDFKS